MKKLIAFCGLDCEQCDARKATIDNDNALRNKPEMIKCDGCRADGLKTPYCDSLCPIRQCALCKEVEHCGDCEAMDGCKTVGMVTSNNAEALNNLKIK